MTIDLQVLTEAKISAVELEGLRVVFKRHGFEATVRPALYRFSEGLLPPSTEIVVALSALFGVFARRAAEDAYKALKDFVVDVLRRDGHREATGTLQLRDVEHVFVLLLPADLPDDAYRSLFEIDLAVLHRGGIVWYSREESQWRIAGPRDTAASST